MTFGTTAVLVGAFFHGTAAAKTTGGCPSNGDWQLVTIESLDLSSTSGSPSLDGNGDGLTCTSFVPANGSAPTSGAYVFRDNTVLTG